MDLNFFIFKFWFLISESMLAEEIHRCERTSSIKKNWSFVMVTSVFFFLRNLS